MTNCYFLWLVWILDEAYRGDDAFDAGSVRQGVALLLLGYANLSDADAKLFTHTMNQFIFASPHRKQQMKENWEQESLATLNKKNNARAA